MAQDRRPSVLRRAVTDALAELTEDADRLPTAADAAYQLTGCTDPGADSMAARALDLLVDQLPATSPARRQLAALRA